LTADEAQQIEAESRRLPADRVGRPRWDIEDLLHRTPLFDVHGKVGRALLQRQRRGRLLELGAQAVD
jgi:hypothetical protein